MRFDIVPYLCYRFLLMLLMRQWIAAAGGHGLAPDADDADVDAHADPAVPADAVDAAIARHQGWAPAASTACP